MSYDLGVNAPTACHHGLHEGVQCPDCERDRRERGGLPAAHVRLIGAALTRAERAEHPSAPRETRHAGGEALNAARNGRYEEAIQWAREAREMGGDGWRELAEVVLLVCGVEAAAVAQRAGDEARAQLLLKRVLARLREG